METNLKGLVRTLDLRHSQGMMPLFEAVSNAMDAVSDRTGKLTDGRIDVHLTRSHDLAAEGSDELQPITGVRVTDDGIGFDDQHLASFREAYTEHKLKSGGKGVGRFTFLKVFEDVEIRSTFRDPAGRLRQRHFRFSTEREVFDESVADSDAEATPGSEVILSELRPTYAAAWPREAEAVAHRLVTHFLIRFASAATPTFYLHDEGIAPINLRTVFDDTVQPHIQEMTFTVGAHEFGLQVFRQRSGKDVHDLSYCAVGREVTGTPLRRLMPDLPQSFQDRDGASFSLQVLVTGEYLDRHANSARTEFLFNPDDEDLASDEGLVARKDLDGTVVATLRSLLQADLQAANEGKMQSITSFVENDAPEYRVLLREEYRPLLERDVPAGASGTRLDEALLRVRRKVEDQVRQAGQEIATLVDRQSFDQYKARMQELISRVNDMGKSQLASYVAHRRAILDLLDLSLKRSRTDNKYPLEEVLHNMIFPMRQTSKDVFLEQQNLWVIDERLCFHTVLASDKPMKSVKGLENTSAKEPDLFAFFYDAPVATQEAEDSTGAVVIVEFKRPMRDNYTTDPAQQVIQRFVEIKHRKVTSIEGRPINPKGLRYFGYLIADLTDSLRQQMEMNYQASVDGEGYFKTLTGGEGYVEIISYDKLMRDAKRRNRVLFEKLGLHKH
ncbi:MAG: sensor histidine kinase [Burkholderiaceae bacterium]|nr:sensor histidine kinase [Burkholderiaceae bacterium]